MGKCQSSVAYLKEVFINICKNKTSRLRISDINRLEETVINLAILKNHHLIPEKVNKVKIYKSGACDKKLKIENIVLSKGAKDVISMAGGEII